MEAIYVGIMVVFGGRGQERRSIRFATKNKSEVIALTHKCYTEQGHNWMGMQLKAFVLDRLIGETNICDKSVNDMDSIENEVTKFIDKVEFELSPYGVLCRKYGIPGDECTKEEKENIKIESDNFRDEFASVFEEAGMEHSEIKYCCDYMGEALLIDNCCDNMRLMIDEFGKNVYDAAIKDGCCGFFDKELVMPSGKVVTIGFNYGH